MAARQSAAMDKAQRLVTSGKATPSVAARLAGVQLQSIYRTAWYKAHRATTKGESNV